eukprot:m.245833 g.245833  ORF g.245833 m.245833 type:complete len:131 (-) comp19054_c0_seq9:43-435(-)
MSGVFGVALPFGLWVAHVLVVAVPVTCLVALLFRVRLWLVPKEKRSVGVLVLGDLGRSPRMQYHCLSLLGHDRPVDTIAYGGKFQHTSATAVSIGFGAVPRGILVCDLRRCLFVRLCLCVRVCLCARACV